MARCLASLNVFMWLSQGRVVLTFAKMGERVQAANIITQSPDERSVNTTCLKGRP